MMTKKNPENFRVTPGFSLGLKNRVTKKEDT